MGAEHKHETRHQKTLNRPCLIPEIENLIRYVIYQKIHEKNKTEYDREQELNGYRKLYHKPTVENNQADDADEGRDVTPGGDTTTGGRGAAPDLGVVDVNFEPKFLI